MNLILFRFIKTMDSSQYQSFPLRYIISTASSSAPPFNGYKESRGTQKLIMVRLQFHQAQSSCAPMYRHKYGVYAPDHGRQDQIAIIRTYDGRATWGRYSGLISVHNTLRADAANKGANTSNDNRHLFQHARVRAVSSKLSNVNHR